MAKKPNGSCSPLDTENTKTNTNLLQILLHHEAGFFFDFFEDKIKDD